MNFNIISNVFFYILIIFASGMAINQTTLEVENTTIAADSELNIKETFREMDNITKYPNRRGNATWSKQVIRGIIIHHSVTDDNTTSRQLNEIGKTRFGVGHSYHFQVDKDGNIEQTNYTWKRTPHAGNGFNTTTIGIVVIGDYSKHKPSKEVVDKLKKLCRWLVQINPNIEYIKGHRDIKSTECPGDYLYKHIPEIQKYAL